MTMFCYQCQEAARNEGCLNRGVCGKTPQVAHLQDLLTWLLKGIAYWAKEGHARGIEHPAAERFVAQGLFGTITNVNFDPDRYVIQIRQALALRDELATLVKPANNGNQPPAEASWIPADFGLETLSLAGQDVGVMSNRQLDPDVRSLRELLVYGLKGLAAYTEHALLLDATDGELLRFLMTALAATGDDSCSADELIALNLRAGQMGVEAMRLLDEANTGAYGHPEPTQVDLSVRPGPAILISGHDLRDLDELLQQTENTGINVYTHGEMLPANAYPAFKKYDHLAGNYGGAWWQQQKEFESFGGAILVTTNCLVEPRASYQDRLFTTGLVGWPGVPHIAERENGEQKDFGPLIDRALQANSPTQLESGSIPIGFAHQTVMQVADKVIAAVQAGDIQRFVVMAGCDGRHNSRSYYTELAQQLPPDHVILTAGCAKYRFNKLALGEIGGIPRLLDAGQCNDSYSLVYIALQLKEALGLEDINDLPISYDISWYEQKAVIVLLALLYLGVKHIRLGPSLPAFLSPGVLNVLVEQFDIKPIGTVESDLVAITAGR